MRTWTTGQGPASTTVTGTTGWDAALLDGLADDIGRRADLRELVSDLGRLPEDPTVFHAFGWHGSGVNGAQAGARPLAHGRAARREGRGDHAHDRAAWEAFLLGQAP